MENPMKKQGMFSWYELMTTDVEGAKKFYGDLLGWEFVTDDSAGMQYTMAKLKDSEFPIAGIIDRDSAMVENKEMIHHIGDAISL